MALVENRKSYVYHTSNRSESNTRGPAVRSFRSFRNAIYKWCKYLIFHKKYQCSFARVCRSRPVGATYLNHLSGYATLFQDVAHPICISQNENVSCTFHRRLLSRASATLGYMIGNYPTHLRIKKPSKFASSTRYTDSSGSIRNSSTLLCE